MNNENGDYQSTPAKRQKQNNKFSVKNLANLFWLSKKSHQKLLNYYNIYQIS